MNRFHAKMYESSSWAIPLRPMQLFNIWLLGSLVLSSHAEPSCDTEGMSFIQMPKQEDGHADHQKWLTRSKIGGNTSSQAFFLPFNSRFQSEHPQDRKVPMPTRIAKEWKSERDLAMVGPVKKLLWTPVENLTYELLFFSAIPTFGKDGNFIALLHDLWTDSNPEDFFQALKQYPLYCSGANGAHKSPLHVYSWEHGERGTQVSVNFRCNWPSKERHQDSFEVFLEDAHGKAIGSLRAEHNRSLFNKTYGTMACVREIFCTNQSNAPLKLLPEWMEFHAMHGIDHFLVYTFDDTDPGFEAVMTPYIDSGLATRIHFHQYPERHVRHHRQMVDCLFRAKSRAKWLMPTVDTDEFLHVDPQIYKGKKVPQNYLGSAWDAVLDHFQAKKKEVHSMNFEFYRFSRSKRNAVEISSTLREAKNNKNNEGRMKYVVNVQNVHGVWVHFPTNWEEGTYEINLPKDLIYGNHYRYEDHIMYGENDTTATIEDLSLAADVQPLEEALQKRFGEETSKFLERLSYVKPKTDVDIRLHRSKSRHNKLDPVDEFTFQQDDDRKAAAAARGDNVGGAALFKEEKKLAKLITAFYSD